MTLTTMKTKKRKTSRTDKKQQLPLPLRRGSISQIIRDVKKHKVIAFDTEWDSKNGMNPDYPGFCIHGASFATPSGYAIYCTSKKEVKRLFRELIPIKDIEWVSHSCHVDWSAVRLSSWIDDDLDYPEKIADTMSAANLLYDNFEPNQLGIKYLVKLFFGYQMVEYEESSEHGLDTEDFHDYAMDDAYWELKFYLRHARPKLVKEGLFKYFITVQTHTTFSDLRIEGIHPDPEKSLELIHVFSDKIEEIKENIWNRVKPFNIASPKQLVNVMIEDLKIPESIFPRTPTGAISTSDEAIEEVANRHPFLKDISYYRTAKKMISTYLSPCILDAEKLRKGYLYPDYRLDSKTGRTRCSGYSSQTMPGKFYEGPFEGIAIRDAFCAQEGHILVGADASQGELRLMAHITKDPVLMEAYLAWFCNTCKETGQSKEILHNCPRCGAEENEKILKDNVPGFWHGRDLHQNTYEKVDAIKSRSDAKAVNFLVTYGGTGYRLNAMHPQNSREEWDEIADDWLRVHAKVKKFHEDTEKLLQPSRMQPMTTWCWKRKAMIETRGVIVKDLFGRKRRIPRDALVSKKGKNMSKHVLNQLLNFPAQASLCAWCQLAMTQFRAEMVDLGIWMKEVKPWAFIHDEWVLSVKEEFAKEVGERLQWHIENVVQISVPMRSSLSYSKSWGALK